MGAGVLHRSARRGRYRQSLGDWDERLVHSSRGRRSSRARPVWCEQDTDWLVPNPWLKNWMVVEAIASIGAGILAGSVLLTAFGVWLVGETREAFEEAREGNSDDDD